MLEHTSDAYIEAWGSSLEEAFEQAAKGMYSVIIDQRKVRRKDKRSLRLQEVNDLQSLLYSWLEHLLVLFDTERFVAREFTINMDRLSNSFRLDAQLVGEVVDSSRNIFRREVKAITYHAMEIMKKDNRYTIRFILDL